MIKLLEIAKSRVYEIIELSDVKKYRIKNKEFELKYGIKINFQPNSKLQMLSQIIGKAKEENKNTSLEEPYRVWIITNN